MAEKKIMCGGFLVGDGLDIDGKTLYATGGGGGDSKVFDIEFVSEVTEGYNYIIHSATPSDLIGVIFLRGQVHGQTISGIAPYYYVKMEDSGLTQEALLSLADITFPVTFGATLVIQGISGDGVAVFAPSGS